METEKVSERSDTFPGYVFRNCRPVYKSESRDGKSSTIE